MSYVLRDYYDMEDYFQPISDGKLYARVVHFHPPKMGKGQASGGCYDRTSGMNAGVFYPDLGAYEGAPHFNPYKTPAEGWYNMNLLKKEGKLKTNGFNGMLRGKPDEFYAKPLRKPNIDRRQFYGGDLRSLSHDGSYTTSRGTYGGKSTEMAELRGADGKQVPKNGGRRGKVQYPYTWKIEKFGNGRDLFPKPDCNGVDRNINTDHAYAAEFDYPIKLSNMGVDCFEPGYVRKKNRIRIAEKQDLETRSKSVARERRFKELAETEELETSMSRAWGPVPNEMNKPPDAIQLSLGKNYKDVIQSKKPVKIMFMGEFMN